VWCEGDTSFNQTPQDPPSLSYVTTREALPVLKTLLEHLAESLLIQAPYAGAPVETSESAPQLL